MVQVLISMKHIVRDYPLLNSNVGFEFNIIAKRSQERHTLALSKLPIVSLDPKEELNTGVHRVASSSQLS